MGSPAGIPDVSVRLTAQGVQDVVNAFQRVRQEAKHTGEEGAAGVELLNGALETLSELLPALSVVLAVEHIIEMGAAAYEYAENLGKLAEKTGISASALSVLNLVAQETGVETEALSKGIIKLEKASQDAADGAAKPKKAFTDLGITLADLKSKSPDQLFTLVAQKLSEIESPGLRAQSTIALFGKAGVELTPILKKVAEEGFDNLQARAQRLGVYLSDDFAEKAKQTKSDLADLAAAGQGMALQFDTGFLPAVDGVANALVDLVGGADGFRQWGVGVGDIVITLAAGFATLVKNIKLAYSEQEIIAARIHSVDDKINATVRPTSASPASAKTQLNDCNAQ